MESSTKTANMTSRTRIPLQDIAYITNGYSFRTSIQSKAGSTGFVLQAADIQAPQISVEGLTLYDTSSFSSDRLLQDGDIVLSAKLSLKSAVYRGQDSIIPNSSVVVIRIHDKRYIPEYISFGLNSKPLYHAMKNLSIGHTHRSIRIGDIRSISLPQISLSDQQELLEQSLRVDELKRMYALKGQYLDAVRDAFFINLMTQ